MRKKGKTKLTRVLWLLWQYLIFFCLMSIIVTCCMLLFISSMRSAIGFELTKDTIKPAALFTFINVVILCLIFTVAADIWRKFTIERPAQKIIKASEKLIDGDFSVRIKPIQGIDTADLNVIIECFNKLAAELSGIETLRTDFIANVSHELKTPLAVMGNYGTLLQQPGLTEDKRIEYAMAITASSKKLSALITNILRFNKLENQQLFPKASAFNLGEQLCECLLTFESDWEEKELELDTEIEEDVFVKTDAEMLALVWNNLFSNAVKFTEPHGRISLKLATDGGYAIVTVADSGCGISREVGQHIFEKFYQGDTSHSMQGNGLGLALVKRVVDIIGGEIFVESEVGKGSAFTVKITREPYEKN